MSFGIYKQREGYWVRMLTAAGIIALTLATGWWAWAQAATLADNERVFPKTRYSTVISDAPATIIGQQAEFLDSVGTVIGTGQVTSYDENEELLVTGAEVIKPSDSDLPAPLLSDAATIRIAGEAYAPNVTPTGRPSIEPTYLQGAVALLVLLGGAFLTYYFVGTKKSSVDFLIATDLEMRKVNWSTRRDVIQSTNVVIVITVLLTLALLSFDLIFQSIGRAINLLH